MSVKLVVKCNGHECWACKVFDGGNIRAHVNMLKKNGWTKGRGVGDSSHARPRLDWCPACTKRRANAKRSLRRSK